MIQLNQIRIKNFMPFRGVQTLSLCGIGTVLIEGENKDDWKADSNKSGKSSLIEALCWCWFGKTIRGLRYDGVVNRFVKKNCVVSTEFEKQGKTYHAFRYCKHKKFKNSLRVWRGEKLISRRHKAETQKLLEEILGFDFVGFSNSVVLGGVRPFSALTDQEQKKVLEAFLSYDQLDRAVRKAQTKLGVVTSELDRARARLAVLAAGAEAKNSHKKLLYESLRKMEEEFMNEGVSLQKERKALLSEVTALRDVKPEYEQAWAKMARLKERRRLSEEDFHEIGESLENVRKLVGSLCPVCRQPVTKLSYQTVAKMLQDNRAKDREKLELLTEDCKKAQKKVKALRQKIERVSQLEQKIGVVDWKLKKVEKTPTKEFVSREAELASVAYSRMLQRKLKVQREVQKKEELEKEVRFWMDGFGPNGIKAMLTRESLPKINETLKRYSQKLLEEKDEVSLVPSKETKSGEERELFHVEYRSASGADSYVGESSGGRKRVDIAVLLTFSSLFRKTNLLFIDELLDGLDETGREAALSILSESYGTVFVITHRKELKVGVGKRLLVQKHKGSARLIWQES